MLIKRISLLTGAEHIREVPITNNQATALNHGLVQEICPNLSTVDREFLISGITQEEWEDAFGGPMDAESDDEIAGLQ
tara:strand:+ start:430 stop:663 length:234 start_codon:yes stop_codon:yes gene_type:complete